MEEDALVLLDYFANFFEGLDNTGFVVDGHYRNEGRRWSDGSLQDLEVDDAVLLNREVSDLEAFFREFSARIEDTFVFGLDGDDVVLLLLVEASNTLDDHVI